MKSPALVTFAARLEQAGVDLEILIGAHEILRSTSRRRRGSWRNTSSARRRRSTREVLEVLRALGLEGVLVVAQEMEQVLRDARVGAGTKLPTGTPRKK